MIRPLVISVTCLLASVFAFGSVPSKLQPDEPLTREGLGDLKMARKQYHEAIDSYADELRAHPANAVVWNKLGIAYHQLLDFPKARAMYEKASHLNKKYSEAINNLGTIYYAQKNFRKAIRLYQQALDLAPDSASIHSNLGTALFARKKYPEAINAYQKALELDPDVFEHHNSYGVLLQERSVEDRAMFDFILARTYAGANNNDRAIEYLRKALEEGFHEQKKIYEDPAFASMLKLPMFTELMANPPVAMPR